MKQTHYLHAIPRKGEILICNPPIEANLELEYDVWVCNIPELNNYDCGSNVLDCLTAVENSIVFCYHNYALESDENMTVGAIQLANWLRERIHVSHT